MVPHAATTDGISIRWLGGAALLAGLSLTACGGEQDDPAPPSSAIQREVTGSFATAPANAPEAELPPLPERPPRTELKNGLVIEVLEPGDGRRAAQVGDRLSIHYDARLADGDEQELVESTHAAGIPFQLRLGEGDVVRGLERGLSGAREGDLLRLFVPSSLGYGERAVGAVPSGADLIFEVRLLRIAE